MMLVTAPNFHQVPAVFPRRSLDPHDSRHGRFITASPARIAFKNSPLTCNDVTIFICETGALVHRYIDFLVVRMRLSVSV
jgi:hypothetical protein